MGTWDHPSQRGKGYLLIPVEFSNSRIRPSCWQKGLQVTKMASGLVKLVSLQVKYKTKKNLFHPGDG
jgi:hypothetical protein